MAKNIALSDDVYRDLKRMKRKDESFSNLIRRLMKTRGMISNLAGTSTLSTEEWLELYKLREKQDMADKERAESLLPQQEG